MLLIVPPSEGKNAPAKGAPVNLDRLSFPELGEQRAQAIDALQTLSRGDEQTALAELKLGPRSREELVHNHDLRAAPSAPASAIYTGVLFDRLGYDSLDEAARRRARRALLITSALWGVLRPADRIPAYRHPATARLPSMPSSKLHWRAAIDAALPSDELVVDFRSGPYREIWRGPADAPTVTIDVVREGPTGRTVVSHDAKATRGDIARALLGDGQAWRRKATPEHVAERVAAAGWTVELGEIGRNGTVALTVVE